MESNYGIAKNFVDAFNNLGLELNTKELFEAYYVERDDSPVLELKERILMGEFPSKYLFTGLRACGKTTELRRLMFMLEEDFFIVYFSAMDELELVDVDYKDVILCMVLQTLKTAEKQKIVISDDISNDLFDLLKQISGELMVSRVEKKLGN